MTSTALNNIRVVLVNTSHPGNIGAAARAMKNMGLSHLVLVAPKLFPADRATWRAAGAVGVLEQARVVETLDEALADCTLVIGTSARERRIPWPLLTPRECGDQVRGEAEKSQVAIIFGREDRGLTNEELHKCHFHVHIPANSEYSSLNLAAAVQVICYEIRVSHLELAAGKKLHFDDWDMPPANQQALEHFYAHLQETLEKMGFLEEDNPRQTVTRLRRLFGRIRLDKMELNILRGMLTSIQNYMYRTSRKEQAASDKQKQ